MLRCSLKLFPSCWKTTGFCRDSCSRKWSAGRVEKLENQINSKFLLTFPWGPIQQEKCPPVQLFHQLGPHWRRRCAASGSRGSTSPEGITETRRAQTRLGLDRECYVDYKQGNFMDFTVHTRSSLQAPSYKYPLCLSRRAACKEQQQSRSCRRQGWDGSCTGSRDWGCTSGFSSTPRGRCPFARPVA